MAEPPTLLILIEAGAEQFGKFNLNFYQMLHATEGWVGWIQMERIVGLILKYDHNFAVKNLLALVSHLWRRHNGLYSLK